MAIGHPGTLLFTSYGCSSPACAAVAFQLFLLIPMCPQQCLLLVSVQKKTCKQKHMAWYVGFLKWCLPKSPRVSILDDLGVHPLGNLHVQWLIKVCAFKMEALIIWRVPCLTSDAWHHAGFNSSVSWSYGGRGTCLLAGFSPFKVSSEYLGLFEKGMESKSSKHHQSNPP